MKITYTVYQVIDNWQEVVLKFIEEFETKEMAEDFIEEKITANPYKFILLECYGRPDNYIKVGNRFHSR